MNFNIAVLQRNFLHFLIFLFILLNDIQAFDCQSNRSPSCCVTMGDSRTSSNKEADTTPSNAAATAAGVNRHNNDNVWSTHDVRNRMQHKDAVTFELGAPQYQILNADEKIEIISEGQANYYENMRQLGQLPWSRTKNQKIKKRKNATAMDLKKSNNVLMTTVTLPTTTPTSLPQHHQRYNRPQSTTVAKEMISKFSLPTNTIKNTSSSLSSVESATTSTLETAAELPTKATISTAPSRAFRLQNQSSTLKKKSLNKKHMKISTAATLTNINHDNNLKSERYSRILPMQPIDYDQVATQQNFEMSQQHIQQQQIQQHQIQQQQQQQQLQQQQRERWYHHEPQTTIKFFENLRAIEQKPWMPKSMPQNHFQLTPKIKFQPILNNLYRYNNFKEREIENNYNNYIPYNYHVGNNVNYMPPPPHIRDFANLYREALQQQR